MLMVNISFYNSNIPYFTFNDRKKKRRKCLAFTSIKLIKSVIFLILKFGVLFYLWDVKKQTIARST